MTGIARRMTPVGDVLSMSVALSRGIVLAAVVAGIGLSAMPPGRLVTSFTLVIAGVGLLVGLPHGSVDHLLAIRSTGRPIPVVMTAYAALAVLTWVGLSAAGQVALGSVLVLSLVHFGLGEMQVYRRCLGWPSGRTVSIAVAVAGTGALLLPLARSGDLVQVIAAALSPTLASILAVDAVRLGLGTLWILAAGVTVLAAVRAGQRTVVLDIALIGLLGTTAPPLVAFAVWFGGWHAVRHTGRLLSTEPGCAELVAVGRTGAAVRRFARLGRWPSMAACIGLVLLLAATATAPDLELAVAELLRVLLALTVPHMVIVFWLDRQPQESWC